MAPFFLNIVILYFDSCLSALFYQLLIGINDHYYYYAFLYFKGSTDVRSPEQKAHGIISLQKPESGSLGHLNGHYDNIFQTHAESSSNSKGNETTKQKAR